MRVVALTDFLVGPKQNVLADDRLVVGLLVETGGRQTFMKVRTASAMVIAVVSLAVPVDGELRAAFGSAGPVPTRSSAPARRRRGRSPTSSRRQPARSTTSVEPPPTAGALRVLTKRALDRCFA